MILIKDKNYNTIFRVEGENIKDRNYNVLYRIDGSLTGNQFAAVVCHLE